MSKWYQYLLNPIGTIGYNAVKKLQDYIESHMTNRTEHGEGIETTRVTNIDRNVDPDKGGVGDFLNTIWDDLTGKSQIELQNQLDREMAEEEYRRNLQSIDDTASAYEAAGFNRNLMYGSSSTGYSAPALQAYSGSSKLDTILGRVGKVLNIIPAMYQASAALESIDQARERTKQQEIKTMTDGINMLRNGYEFGRIQYSLPFIPIFNRPGRNWEDQSDFIKFTGNSDGSTRRYVDASLKNTMDLLESVGISNQLRSTRNSYLGYQYDLDRRFGAAGRIVGMASQGLGAASKFLPLNSFFRR